MTGLYFFYILNLLEHRENRKLVAEHLCTQFPEPDPTSLEAFDAFKPILRLVDGDDGWKAPVDGIIVDGPGFRRWEQEILDKKASDHPLFLPVLLVLQEREIGLADKGLWRSVDEILWTPMRRVELNARIAVLLRARQLSRELDLRNQELRTFLYLLAHDLKAPMRAVVGFSELLEEDPHGCMPSQTLEMLQRIRRCSLDMTAMVDEVLNLMRLETASSLLGPVDMAEVMDEVRSRLQDETKRRHATIHGPSQWPNVLGSKPLLVSVFQNILSNALKYTAPGIRPEIRLDWEEISWGYRFFVMDNGIGIPQDKIPLIFKPFTRLHGTEEYPGIGLGLTAVKRIMDLLHGRIHVQSQVGQGTCFVLELMRDAHVENPHCR